MDYDLAAAARRVRKPRRKYVTLRDVSAPATMATELYQTFYRPVVAVWAEAAPLIAAEYARSLASISATTDVIRKIDFRDSPADIQADINAASETANRLILTLTPSLRTWVLRVEQIVRGRWRNTVLSATGVDLQTVLGPADVRDTLENYIAWNTDLVKDVSDQVRKRIADATFSGLSERRSAREVAKQIREAVDMARDRANRIASDQLNKISSSLADERRREAGLDVWEWNHSGKRHPRIEHQARDGRLYSDNRANVGKKVGGKTVNRPPERGDLPGQPPYCACHSRAVLVYEFD